MQILNSLENLNQRIGEPQGLKVLRTQAAGAFNAMSWPSKKLENWRYSPVQRLSDEFIPQIEVGCDNTLSTEKVIEQWSHKGFATIFLNNGELVYVDSELKSQVEIIPLRRAFERGLLDSGMVSNLTDSLEALNICYLDQGFYLHIPGGAKLERPIHWLQTYSSSASAPLFQSRLVVCCESEKPISFTESHLIMGDHEKAWSNVSSIIQVGPKSKLEYVQWNEQTENHQHTSRSTVTIGENAFFHYLQASLSRGWTRSDLTVKFDGQTAEALTHGLGLAYGKGVVDQQTKLIFSGAGNKAEQIYKNLLFDESRTIFNGRIRIEHSGQKTETSQLHQSLLLSEKAEVDTKPELEIFADDVKANHGATVGQLNPEELFYFQSRGISKTKAYQMLCQAYVFDLCDRLSSKEMQSFLKARLQRQLERITP